MRTTSKSTTNNFFIGYREEIIEIDEIKILIKEFGLLIFYYRWTTEVHN